MVFELVKPPATVLLMTSWEERPASALALEAHDLVERNTVSREPAADVPEALTLMLCPIVGYFGTLSLTEYGVAASAAAHNPPLAARTAAEERNRDFVIPGFEPAPPV